MNKMKKLAACLVMVGLLFTAPACIENFNPWNILPMVCAWQPVADAVKNFATSVLADAKARMQQLQEEREMTEDPNIISMIIGAMDKTQAVINRATAIYNTVCNAFTPTQWEQAEATLEGEVVVMKNVYNKTMQKARMMRLNK